MRRLLAVLLVLAGCAGCATGKDAVAVGGRFEFVAPNGQQITFYDPPESRGTLASFAGESLLNPGGVVGIQNYPDQVVVINIWGTWCGPCRVEMPDLEYVHQRRDGPGAAVLGVNIRDSRDAARDFLAGGKVTYDSIYDYPGRVLLELSGYPRNVVPSTIVLDRRHRVAAVYLARIPLAGLMALITKLENEAR